MERPHRLNSVLHMFICLVSSVLHQPSPLMVWLRGPEMRMRKMEGAWCQLTLALLEILAKSCSVSLMNSYELYLHVQAVGASQECH